MVKARSVQRLPKQKLIYVTLPEDEILWNQGDSVRYEKIDENTVVLRRLT